MDKQMNQVSKRLERIELLLEQLACKLEEKTYDNDKPVTMKQAAMYLQLSISRIYSLIYAGKILPVQRQKNSKILFSMDELNRFLKNNNCVMTK